RTTRRVSEGSGRPRELAPFPTRRSSDLKVSFEQKPFRRSMMQTWGGEVIASPSNMTETGRKILAADPNNQGSLGIAISEAVEEADRKSTRLNSSHVKISYAVFCLIKTKP